MLLTALALLLLLSYSTNASSKSIQIYKRSSSRSDVWSFAIRQHDKLLSRYRPKEFIQRLAKRDKFIKRSGTGVNSQALSNLQQDSEYFGSLAVGTPSTSYFVVFDTGSSDFWLAAPGCSTCISSTSTFSLSQSSTTKTSNSPFQVTYGSGQVAGRLISDTITLANYSATNQVFASVDQVSDGLVIEPVSGLMGLGFGSIAQSGATPFWQNAGIPTFSFALTRYDDSSSNADVNPGGFITVGGTNSNYFTGSINFISLLSQSYWLIPLDGLSVNGQLISGSASNNCAIDTGTTLIGAPPAVVQAAYAQITGASQGPAQSGVSGYWQYPCSAKPTVALTFGGISYTISPADFNIGQVSGQRVSLSNSMCLGALFETPQSNASPNWIVGDTFLKNVYSVFQSSPPAVGFATLSTSVQSSNQEASTSTTGSQSTESLATALSHRNGISIIISAFVVAMMIV